MKNLFRLLCALGLFFSLASFAAAQETVLIIRHAQPDEGQGLSDDGQARAAEWARYFQHFTYQGQSLPIGYIYAAIDTGNSQRPRLTLEPTAAELGLTIDTDFQTNKVNKVVKAVKALPPGSVALIGWRHSAIPDLLTSFGADPEALLPHGHWPGKIFGWLIVLQFDADGKLTGSERLSVVSD
jgi:hypothetical protein